jgi:hypothetical protein
MSKRTITLTDRPPVRIDEDNWGIIAMASDHDNQYECQANTVWSIRVRQHDDGRTIVYAVKDSGPGGQYLGFKASRAGELLDKECTMDDICAAIRRVGEYADCADLIDDCIADLPAEEI